MRATRREYPHVADFPDRLEPASARDLRGRGREVWARRVVLALLGVVVAAALAGFVGQPNATHGATAPRADLKLDAPSKLRGGLLWHARIEVRARDRIAHPRIVLGPGWVDGMQVNTIEPAATQEASGDGRIVLSYDTLERGDSLIVYLQLQANPTTAGDQDASVALADGDRPVARIGHTITVLP